MIGRQEALGKLRTAWSLGQMFVVVGEGGIGKSRLLSEFAGQDRSVLIGGARPEDATVPYSTLARLLAAAWDRFEPRLAKGVALEGLTEVAVDGEELCAVARVKDKSRMRDVGRRCILAVCVCGEKRRNCVLRSQRRGTKCVCVCAHCAPVTVVGVGRLLLPALVFFLTATAVTRPSALLPTF